MRTVPVDIVGNGLDHSVDERAKFGCETVPTPSNNSILWHLQDDLNLGGGTVKTVPYRYVQHFLCITDFVRVRPLNVKCQEAGTVLVCGKCHMSGGRHFFAPLQFVWYFLCASLFFGSEKIY